MSRKQQQDYTNYVLMSLRDVNPYTESPTAHAWATGFLAAHLAGILEKDPILARQFKIAIDQQRIRKGLRPN